MLEGSLAVLPGAIVWELFLIIVPVDVVVDIDVLVDVDVDLVVIPVAASPGITPRGTASETDAETDDPDRDVSRGTPVIGGISRIGPWAVDDHGIVRGNIDYLWIGWRDGDDLNLRLGLLYDGHDLLWGGGKVALRLRLGSERLDSRHDA